MGVRNTASEKRVALFDSVTGFAFGPTFSSQDDAESFLDFVQHNYKHDIRTLSERELEAFHALWILSEADAE